MPNQLKGSLLYLTADVRRLLAIFWSILVGLLIMSLVLNVLIYQENVVTFQLSFPLYALSAVIGQMMAKNTIPYLIQMGSTRMNVFKSIGAHFFNIALVNGVLASTIYSLFSFLFGGNESLKQDKGFITIISASDEVISFNHLAEFFANNWGTRILIDTSIMFFLLACGFIIGLIFYRFGLVAGISFIAVTIFVFIIGMTQGWLLDFFIHIFTNMTLVFFVQLFFAGLIIYLLSFSILRRLPIG